jgi:hypothetical protein
MPLARPPKAASLNCREPRATFRRRRASGPCWMARPVQQRPCQRALFGISGSDKLATVIGAVWRLPRQMDRLPVLPQHIGTSQAG